MNLEMQSDILYWSMQTGIPISLSLAFDADSQFFFCADQNGASIRACTVSDVTFEYRSFSEFSSMLAHLTDTDRILCWLTSFSNSFI